MSEAKAKARAISQLEAKARPLKVRKPKPASRRLRAVFDFFPMSAEHKFTCGIKYHTEPKPQSQSRAFSQVEAEARLFLSQEAEAETGFQMPESGLHEAEVGFSFLPMSGVGGRGNIIVHVCMFCFLFCHWVLPKLDNF